MTAGAVAECPTGRTDLTPGRSPSVRGLEERLIWWLWQTRRFDTVAARDLGVDIIFPGWFSTAAGPDFRDAMLADVDGRLERGDVEIHVTDSAWRQHGHDVDPEYNNVRLHVVLCRDSTIPTLTAAGQTVPVLELEPLLRHEIGQLERSLGDWQPAVVRCPHHETNTASLTRALIGAGRDRLHAKVKRMVANVEALGAEEALYRDLAESLGYAANRGAFRRIAEALPFNLLTSIALFEREQLLLGAAGLASSSDLLSPYLDGPVLRAGELVTFRVRPSNSPPVRLRGLARLVELHRSGLVGPISSTPVERMWTQFTVSADSVLIGRGRADDIVLNVAIPFLVAYCELNGDAVLSRLPAPPGNRWVDSLRAHLTDSGLVLRPFNALHHLGLQELSLRFCRYDHCEACPLHGEWVVAD